MLSNVRKLI